MAKQKVIAGVGIGCLVLLVALGMGGFFLFKKGKEKVSELMAVQEARAELAANWTAPGELTKETLAPAKVGNATMSNFQEIEGNPAYGSNDPGFQITYTDAATTYQVYYLPSAPDYTTTLGTHLETKSNRSQMELGPVMTYSTSAPRDNGAVFTMGPSVHASADADVEVYPWLEQYLKAISASSLPDPAE